MSESTPEVKTEEVSPEQVKITETIVETINNAVPIPDAMKTEVEKIVKDVVKSAIKELLDELKKSPLMGTLDKDGDGVISVSEVKEVVAVHAQKLGCGPSCTIS
jgi:Ca2+-binding EF-hand superfamily protein